MWDIKRDSPVDVERVYFFRQRGSSKCLARAEPGVKPLSSFQLELREFKSGARRKASTFCSCRCFSRSVRMRVEVDRERKASSGLWGEKKTDINSNQGCGESWCFKACLFALPSQISSQSEYMPAGMGTVFILTLFMIQSTSLRQTFLSPMSDWTLSTNRTEIQIEGVVMRNTLEMKSLKVIRWLNSNSSNKWPPFLHSFWCFWLFSVFFFFITSKERAHLLRRLWLLGSGSIDLWVSTRFVQ